MIIRSPVKIRFYYYIEYLFWFTKIWLTNQLFKITLIPPPINQCLPEIRGWPCVVDKNVSVITSLSGSSGIYTGGSGTLSNCGSRIIFSPAQYLSKVKGCGAEESHQQALICMALSHLEIIEENLWLGIHPDLQISLKIYVTTVGQLFFLLPLPTDCVYSKFCHFSIIHDSWVISLLKKR